MQNRRSMRSIQPPIRTEPARNRTASQNSAPDCRHPSGVTATQPTSLVAKSRKPPIETPIQVSATDRLIAIGTSIATTALGSRQQLWNSLAEIVIIARHLRDNEDAWVRFCDHPLWSRMQRGRPKPGNPGNVLLRAIQFSLSGVDGNDGKLASRYHRAVRPYLEGALSIKAIAADIEKAGGIEKLARRKHQGPSQFEFDIDDKVADSIRVLLDSSPGPYPLQRMLVRVERPTQGGAQTKLSLAEHVPHVPKALSPKPATNSLRRGPPSRPAPSA